MKNDLICPICGEPTSVYMGNARKDRLCKMHGKQAKDGLIEQCPDCGKWHDTDKLCECNENKKTFKPIEVNSDNELTCIVCGEPSNGKHFCINCYHKYKDRSIDIRITNCRETEIIDEYGNRKYTCDDGRKVRSRAELAIGNWLFNNKIRAIYEREVYYEENGETKTLHPDFYLPDQEYFIEYNELTNKPYLQSKEYAKKIYDKIGAKVIIMTDKDLENIAACLKPKLGLH